MAARSENSPSYEAISAGHAIAKNGRTHGQQTTHGGYMLVDHFISSTVE
jgi:hypothetical protein